MRPPRYRFPDQVRTTTREMVARMVGHFIAMSIGAIVHGGAMAEIMIGHFFAMGHDPVAYLRAYHQRITNIHVKDRKSNRGREMPFGLKPEDKYDTA